MSRSKTIPKLIVLVTVGILIFGFIPAVIASEGKGRVTIRPIEDWLYPNNPFGFSDFVDPDSNLVVKKGFPFPPESMPNVLDETSLVEGETEFDGFILERVLNDGRAELTVHLFVKNSPMTVYNWGEFSYYVWGGGPRPSAIIGAWEDGYIDYTVEYKFILDKPGQEEIPFVWDIYFDPEVFVSLRIVGTGYGALTEHAADFGFTPGAKGKVFTNQICLMKPQIKEDNPNMWYPELWPVEIVKIHKLGMKE